MDDTLTRVSYSRPRFSVLLMAVSGVLGLLLVGTGVYGVMTYVVSRQMREIGIRRLALGAQRGRVFGWVFSGAFRLIAIGTFLGGIASFATNRVIATQVWTVRMFDPISLGSAVGLIVILGGAACFHPHFEQHAWTRSSRYVKSKGTDPAKSRSATNPKWVFTYGVGFTGPPAM